jgi:hypothetical protein
MGCDCQKKEHEERCIYSKKNKLLDELDTLRMIQFRLEPGWVRIPESEWEQVMYRVFGDEISKSKVSFPTMSLNMLNKRRIELERLLRDISDIFIPGWISDCNCYSVRDMETVIQRIDKLLSAGFIKQKVYDALDKELNT